MEYATSFKIANNKHNKFNQIAQEFKDKLINNHQDKIINKLIVEQDKSNNNNSKE